MKDIYVLERKGHLACPSELTARKLETPVPDPTIWRHRRKI